VSDMQPLRPEGSAYGIRPWQFSRPSAHLSETTSSALKSSSSHATEYAGSRRPQLDAATLNLAPASSVRSPKMLHPAQSTARTVRDAPSGVGLLSPGEAQRADFALDDSKSFASSPDLTFALDGPESIDIGVDDELRSFASLRSWRENNSRSFRPRTECPPRALATVGRQHCLSERELSDIIDAANTSVRSFDRQLYDPVSNDWKYVEGRDHAKSRWKLPTPTQKALMRSERVDALDADDPAIPLERSRVSSDQFSGGRRRSMSDSSSADLEWRTTAATRPPSSDDKAISNCAETNARILPTMNVIVPALTSITADASTPVNRGIPAELKFTGIDELDPVADCGESYLSLLLSQAEDDMHAVPMSPTPPSGPQSSSLVTIESPSAGTNATGVISSR
jgi:hypothetical protein